MLAEAGYDVWISNSRGNFYSKSHIELNPENSEFWNFSWYEMAKYDYPAIIDHVCKVTGNKKVFIVGHSQGTTALLTLLSELPEYNERVAAVSLMAPVAYFANSGTLLNIFSKLVWALKVGSDKQKISSTASIYKLTKFCFRICVGVKNFYRES